MCVVGHLFLSNKEQLTLFVKCISVLRETARKTEI